MYQIEKFDENIKIKISASYDLMEKICLEVENFSKEKKFNQNNFALQLCVREALTNSIRHGCMNDINKHIFFEIEWIDDSMKVIIEDEGNGFDWKKEVVFSEKLTSCGRGRNIIKIYSDDISYNEKGNVIKPGKVGYDIMVVSIR